MWSSEHAAVGGAVSAALVVLLRWPRSLAGKLLLWSYGVLLSVVIDLDHFLLARIRAGDWSHLRAALSNPVEAFTEQESVFPGLELRVQRLLSHAVLGGALALASALVAPTFAVFTAVVVSAHVIADLLRDAELA